MVVKDACQQNWMDAIQKSEAWTGGRKRLPSNETNQAL